VSRGCGQTKRRWGVCAPALKLHLVWEGPWKKGQGFKPDHGKSGRPALWGGLRKRGHGGNAIPRRNRKSETGNPPPTAGAPELYPNTWAACLQFRAHAVRNVANALVDRSHPENESVPFDVLIGACGQFTPGHKQSTLEGSFFTVESNVVNEAVEVPSSHPQSVSGGGHRNSRSDFYFTSLRFYRKALISRGLRKPNCGQATTNRLPTVEPSSM
jgi:hypothetical protein